MEIKYAEKIEAAASLRGAINEISKNKFLIGFDGFVDQIIHVVNTRSSVNEYIRVETIKEFGERIVSAAGKSANIELVSKVAKIGGNGPLMANAVLGAGSGVTIVGLLGYPDIWPVFKPLADQCKLITCGNPGSTDALEFNDGKLMLGKLNSLKDLNWDRICEVIGENEFFSLLLGHKIVAITNWTMLVGLKDIMDKIIEKLPEDSGLTFFFDLADPEKRLKFEIEYVLNQIAKLDKKANCVLGLNLREAEQVSEVLNLNEVVEDGVIGLEACAKRIKEKIGNYGVVIHSVSFAAAAVANDSAAVEGPFCQIPKITTGAGDHFNGGFCTALMGGLSLNSVLLAGVATSGWYVRAGGPSPKLEDTASLLEKWANNELTDDIPSKQLGSARIK